MLKDILLLCDGSEGLPSATAAAVALARAHAASLAALCLHPGKGVAAAPDPASPAARARVYFEEMAALQGGGTWRWDDAAGPPSRLIERAVSESRAHDVVIIDMPAGGTHPVFAGLPRDIMQRGGRPVILWPDDHAPAPIGRHVLVLWQGSAAAARALHESLPILRQASVIEIAGATAAPAPAPLRHLRNHGVPAIPCARSFAPGHAEELIDDSRYDLIVLGANGGVAAAFSRFLDRRHTPLFLSC